ncbi:hypothetical protein [Croceicoccus bisphenolivorans]|uniref:hypothetical protein n=1 Tax=Croceicoccus bisphenolivorans TaxID=1783232 RepID=UPI00083338CF|nr:hypothetical protein [Croceicoccus bisphenolivorans]
MARIGLLGAGTVVLVSLALTGCEDPKPGLEDEVRVEKVVSCKDAIGHFAPTERKKEQLCECTTAKLASQGLTVADLSGAKQDRAMEQLRWCLAQVGLGRKVQRPAAEVSEAPSDEQAEPESEATDAPVEAEGAVAAE